MPTTWGFILFCAFFTFVFQVSAVIIVFSNHKRWLFSIIFVILFIVISYLGSPAMIHIKNNNLLYLPAVALFAYTIFIISFTLPMAFITRNDNLKEMAVKSFSTISLLLIIPYCTHTGLYLRSPTTVSGFMFFVWIMGITVGFGITRIKGLTSKKIKQGNLQVVLHSVMIVILFAIFTHEYLGPFLPLLVKYIYVGILVVTGIFYLIYILAIRGGEPLEDSEKTY